MRLASRVCIIKGSDPLHVANTETESIDRRGSDPFNAPDVPFQMLTALPLTKKHWQQIARNASWTMTRMNLNTFVRQGVFEDQDLIGIVANRLRNANLIEKAKVFPCQLLTAWMSISDDVPRPIRDALQDAMEIAIRKLLSFHSVTTLHHAN